MTGITGRALVEGTGWVNWTIRDDTGRKHVIRTIAHYVPGADIRLLSPQKYLQQPEIHDGNGSFTMTSHGAVFQFPHTRQRLSFEMDWLPLPMAKVVSVETPGQDRVSLGNLSVTDVDNLNLDPASKELLQWHFKLGHYNLPWVQRLTRVREGDKEPVLRTRHKKTSSLHPLPLCAACQFAKAKRRPTEAVKETKELKKDGALSKNVVLPGQVVSTDQYTSLVRGRLFHTKGKEPVGKSIAEEQCMWTMRLRSHIS